MCTIYLTDINSYSEFNLVYQEMLTQTNAASAPPCRACFAIQALPLGGRVEIECEAVTSTAASTRKVLVPGVPNLFSAAVTGGSDQMVWVAGQLSFKDGALHGTNITEQADGAIDCLDSVLSTAGTSLSALVRTTVFLTNMNQYGPMNEVYGTKLNLTNSQSGQPPTRAAFCVKDLPLNGIIEISAVCASNPDLNTTQSGLSASPVYSPAVTTGTSCKMVWVSGQVALDANSGTKVLVGAGDVSKETLQAMTNMKNVLEKSGSDMKHVLKVNIYCADMNDYSLINEVYASFFGVDSPPARACVQVKELPLKARVEVCCVAIEVQQSSM
jgi:2-iminobutanoate/2-iminopropanoate deaminase